MLHLIELHTVMLGEETHKTSTCYWLVHSYTKLENVKETINGFKNAHCLVRGSDP